ncbi:MAG: hypothetical protein J7L43_00050 [Candidatus Aenigmarchaeota archaeon]|nr:hypothetical protein [Candidatus Aenigmarchaeota archaeon]
MMSNLLPQIISLASVDAINPCTLAVQVILLGGLVATKGRRHALLGGLLFSFTVFVVYFLYGFGILQILYNLGLQNIFLYILLSLLVVMMLLEFSGYFSYKPGFRSLEMPMKFRPIAQRLLKSIENPWFTIPVAFLCSVLLLPCSSGPYLTMLLYLVNTEVEKFWVLLFYNAIFVFPMILITLLVAFGTSPEKIKEWRNKHIRELHLISGILLLIVFLYTIYTMVSI